MSEKPAYKQFWPWFLFGLPGIVVIAGLSTWWIAANNADHLVADDYYKDGLAINKELRKQQLARSMNIEAQLGLTGNIVNVHLQSDIEPAALHLDFYHPLDANQDFSLQLARLEAGVFHGRLASPLQHNWHWSLQPLGVKDTQQWQIDGEIRAQATDGH